MTGYVYCAQNSYGHIKFGYTKSLEQRFKQLKYASGNDVERVAYATGTREHELALHKALKPFKLEGEWYKPSPMILAVISRMARWIPEDHGKTIKACKAWNWLHRARVLSGLTADDLSRRLGVARTTLYSFEGGYRNISLSTCFKAQALFSELGVEIDHDEIVQTYLNYGSRSNSSQAQQGA